MIFHKLKNLIDANEDTLYEIFLNYDYENKGTILVQDLPRAFKRLGILHPEPHMKALMEAGGVRESDEKVDYVIYA